MRKITTIVLITLSMAALCSFTNNTSATCINQSSTVADSSKPKMQKNAESVSAVPKKDTATQQPVFVLQGSYQDFLLLRNALYTLKFYSKKEAPGVNEVELMKWIDDQLNYQVDLLKQKRTEKR